MLERRVRTTFVNVTDPLGYRPAPTSVLDKTASKEARRPWASYADTMRNVATAAAVVGGPTALDTRERIIDAVLALAAHVLEPLDDGIPLDVVLFTRLVAEEAEAVEAQAVARAMGTAEARATAIVETEDAILAGRCYVTHERARLQQAGGSIALVRG